MKCHNNWLFIVISPSNIIRNLFRCLMLMGNMSRGSPQKFWLIMHGSSHITMQFIWKIESSLPPPPPPKKRKKPNASCCLSVAFDRGGPKRLIRQWGKHFGIFRRYRKRTNGKICIKYFLESGCNIFFQLELSDGAMGSVTVCLCSGWTLWLNVCV